MVEYDSLEEFGEDEKKSATGKKFSLIELLMIIMLVGIILTLIIPLRNDKIFRDKVKEAIYNLQLIAHADQGFYNNPENNYYVFDLGMIKDYMKEPMKKIGDNLMFDYTLTDTTIVATTNEHFGKKGAQILYYLPKGPFQVAKDKLSRDTIDPNWLP